ncbi:HAD family hydrolase [Halococcoides cellulosivorans]|uniref:HAD family hydrolase n=1 Tax=Halococcoides cellulosivorans TaxID=1679096 RepID=A0A2R4WZM1_9EURY|nr:HAD-IA family hydrolase [Halococcoides cellulosivorans]AWB26981.1 hypothetical protein HARCEL1_04270 [Halococcoides cellulosivorans]
MDYRAVLFDYDGVIATPSPHDVLVAGTRAGCRAAGIDPSPETVESLVAGVTVADLRAVADRHGVHPGRLWFHRDRHSSRAQRGARRAGWVTPYPDLDGLDALADAGVHLGVVSSNQRQTVRSGLADFGLADRFVTVHARPPTIASLSQKKPAPDYLDRAMAALDVEPSETLFVGDRNGDIRAAHAAGADAFFVRREHRADYALSDDPEYERADLRDLPAIVGVEN